MKVAIGTAFYKIEAFLPYILSLRMSEKLCNEAGIEFEFIPRSGDSYVDRAKNWLVREFLKVGYDQFLLIDSDISWDAKALIQILKSDYDVVAGTYRVKNDWDAYCGSVYTLENDRPMTDSNGLIRAKRIPSGFLKLSRTAVLRFYKAYEHLVYTQDDRSVVPLFQTRIDGVYHGEDSTFCDRWQSIGGEIWLEPRLNLTHWGTKGYEGNFDEFLMIQPGGSKSAKE